jgi:hypothetical protein
VRRQERRDRWPTRAAQQERIDKPGTDQASIVEIGIAVAVEPALIVRTPGRHRRQREQQRDDDGEEPAVMLHQVSEYYADVSLSIRS